MNFPSLYFWVLSNARSCTVNPQVTVLMRTKLPCGTVPHWQQVGNQPEENFAQCLCRSYLYKAAFFSANFLHGKKLAQSAWGWPNKNSERSLNQSNIRKLALVGIIPNQILFSFNSDKDRRTDSRIRRKNTARLEYSQDPGFDSRRGCAVFFELFSSDPAVSSSIFVGVEREENLIRAT